jgi:hypothetical protein
MRFKVFLNIVVAWLALLTLSVPASAQTTPSPLSISFDFRNGSLGWQGGFADYPPSTDDERFALLAEMRNLPPELGVAGTGFYFQGHNRSDDLFMFMKRRLGPSDGIVAGQAYWLDFTVVLASNAQDCGGIGGPPGFGVFVKVGGSPAEPRTLFDSLTSIRNLRMNIDKSNQSQSGIHASVAGNIWNGLPCNLNSQPYVSIQRTHRHIAPVLANSDSELWLLVGTDSGFEGLTGLYYQRIDVTLTPLSTPPSPKLLSTQTSQGSDSGRAAALNSVTMIREPFTVLTIPNFTSDQTTRLILLLYDMELRAGENPSIITAQAKDSQQRVFPLAIEAVRKVPDWEWITQVVVKLPLELDNAGEVSISVSLRGVPSNEALVRIN